MPNQDRYWAHFDEAWKKVIERFSPQLLQFFVPELYFDIDFSREVSFLDKEMEQLSRGDEIRGLFGFIDWVLQLSDYEEDLIWEEVKELEEVKGMPYITSVERIGMRKGLQQGLLEEGREMILEALDERFGEVPSSISNAVTKIEDRDTLKFLLRHAIRSSTLEEFKQALDGRS